jgi:hypothetical protein
MRCGLLLWTSPIDADADATPMDRQHCRVQSAECLTEGTSDSGPNPTRRPEDPVDMQRADMDKQVTVGPWPTGEEARRGEAKRANSHPQYIKILREVAGEKDADTTTH